MGMLNWSNAFSQAGTAAAAVGLEGVKATLEQDRIKLADELAGVREDKREARADVRAADERTHREGLLKTQLTHAETMQGNLFDHQVELQDNGFANDKTLLEARQKFDKDQKELDRGLTREQIRANREIHQADRANAMAIAKMGGTIQTDKDGNVLMIDKEGNTKTIKGVDGEPMKANKDLTPAAKQLAEVIKDRLKAIDANQVMSPEERTQKTEVLNTQLLQVLTGGIGTQKSDKAAPPSRTGWDSTTGDVFKNGEKVGSAKSANEARKLITTPAQTAPQAAAPSVVRGATDFAPLNEGLLNWQGRGRPF